MVEKVDPEEPSYGDVPGTEAYEKRQADAVPDIVLKASDSETSPASPSADDASPDTNSASHSSQSIPETRLSRVDTMPSEDEPSSGPRAHKRSPSDATPDVVETVPDTPTSPDATGPEDTSSQEATPEDHEATQNVEQGAADDFDDFVEEQDDMGDDDFGDFDDGFQEPDAEVDDTTTTASQQPPALPSVVSVTSGLKKGYFNS